MAPLKLLMLPSLLELLMTLNQSACWVVFPIVDVDKSIGLLNLLAYRLIDRIETVAFNGSQILLH